MAVKNDKIRSDKNLTGIENLDLMLHGGVPENSTILLAGEAGTGKTNLALEWLFKGYTKYKERGLYLCLTESVTKMLTNAQKMDYFAPECVGPMQVHFTDLRVVMNDLGIIEEVLDRVQIDQLLSWLSNFIKESGTKRVVIDSITALNYRFISRDLIRTFFFGLANALVQNQVTLIAISEVTEGALSIFGVDEFLADGIFYMYNERIKGQEPVRNFRIVKMRGTNFDANTTPFHISKEGMLLFPKLEKHIDYSASLIKLPTGIQGLDKMFEGGVFKGSSILISGASGTGKTLLALRILITQLEKNEKCLYFSFEESHDQIVRNALSLGWELKKHEKAGNLKIIARPPEEAYLAEHAHSIVHAVETFGASFIAIDSLSSLRNESSELNIGDTIRWISNYLKQKGVTIIYINATTNPFGAPSISDAQISTIIDTIIALRFLEIQSELKHGLLIMKVRGSHHDKSLRKMSFSKNDLVVGEVFKEYEGLLSRRTQLRHH